MSARRYSFAALLGVGVSVLAILAACGDTVTTGPDDAAESAVVATVTADGGPLSGVTVELYAEAGTTVIETGTTDASGEAAFTGLIAGTYDVEITVPAGFAVENDGPVRRTVTVEKSQQATVSFSLVSQP